MAYRGTPKNVSRIRIAGPDKKGIIATVTQFLFQQGCNIEDIDQRIHDQFLIMNMVVDLSSLKTSLPQFLSLLDQTAKKVGCESHFEEKLKKPIKNIALLVSKESHCADTLLKAAKQNKIKGQVGVVIGNHPDLKNLAKTFGKPFHAIESHNKKQHEAQILELVKKYDIDLIVLARYMQILSPEFVFRHEGRIINIHPSLLPAFPGPRSYHQAFNKGVEVVGVTAHFVTTDLDEGPIIAQESFRIDRTKTAVEDIVVRGRKMESKALLRAVKLFLEDRLVLRRGKVLDSKKNKNNDLDQEADL